MNYDRHLRKETEGDKRKKPNCWKIPSSPSSKFKLPQNSVGALHVEGSMRLSWRSLSRCQGGNIYKTLGLSYPAILAFHHFACLESIMLNVYFTNIILILTLQQSYIFQKAHYIPRQISKNSLTL